MSTLATPLLSKLKEAVDALVAEHQVKERVEHHKLLQDVHLHLQPCTRAQVPQVCGHLNALWPIHHTPQHVAVWLARLVCGHLNALWPIHHTPQHVAVWLARLVECIVAHSPYTAARCCLVGASGWRPLHPCTSGIMHSCSSIHQRWRVVVPAFAPVGVCLRLHR